MRILQARSGLYGALILLCWQTCGRADPSMDAARVHGRWPSDACTLDELIPDLDIDPDERWTYESETAGYPKYDCTCPLLKSSYFCDHGRTDFPTWEPKAVADGTCTPISEQIFETEPFPPNTTVLYYGNSHLRQVFEATFCMYRSPLKERKLMLHGPQDTKEDAPHFGAVAIDQQCRGAFPMDQETLTAEGCITEEEENVAYRCADDAAEYTLHNGATVHYLFAHQQHHKLVTEAFEAFGTKASDYDLVIANNGNSPRMSTRNTLISAQTFHDANVPFVWLSTYDGWGDITMWREEERQTFSAANARHVPVHLMVRGLQDFTRSASEGIYNHHLLKDHHFCLPGPPNELSKLLLKICWGLQIELGKA